MKFYIQLREDERTDYKLIEGTPFKKIGKVTLFVGRQYSYNHTKEEFERIPYRNYCCYIEPTGLQFSVHTGKSKEEVIEQTLGMEWRLENVERLALQENERNPQPILKRKKTNGKHSTSILD